jgi:hypothetical protein
MPEDKTTTVTHLQALTEQTLQLWYPQKQEKINESSVVLEMEILF